MLCGSGDTHVAVALERLARKFGVNVTTAEVKVPYRETISANADAEGKVKKQSGGHGQYAVVNMRVQPTERGTGSEFVDKIVGGAIPRNFLPAVQKGVEETMATGGAWVPRRRRQGRVLRRQVPLVDSSDMAFRTAASLGLKEALAKASPVVLEPVSMITVNVPESMQGDVLGDINSRRGRVSGSNPLGDGHIEITALVPAGEISATPSTCAR